VALGRERQPALELTLRGDITFSDGAKLTAAGVKASLEYYAKAGGPLASNLAAVQSIDVLGDGKLRINLSKSNPDLPIYLSTNTTGEVISPTGLAHPDALGNLHGRFRGVRPGPGHHGVGADVHLRAQHPLLRPERDSLEEGRRQGHQGRERHAVGAQVRRVDYAMGEPETAAAARGAGFTVSTTPLSIMQLMLLDRTGKLSPPLGKLEVRQAMMYALDRGAVAKSLFGDYASGYDAAVLDGSDGYSSQLAGKYPYDLAKAKQLLAAAGYPKGFDLPIIVNLTGVGETKAAEAFAASVAGIGINVQIKVPANTNELFSTYMKYPAMMFDYGSPVQTAYSRGNDLLYSWATR